MRYGVVTMVGPGEVEAARLCTLISSLFRHEPATPLLVVVDDSGADAAARVRGLLPDTCTLVLLRNPQPPTYHHLSVNTLIALRYLAAVDVEWVLKLDTDALVIAPFADRVDAIFASRPGLGQVGRFDRRCDGTPSAVNFYSRGARRFRRRLQIWRSPSPGVGQAFWGDRALLRRIAIRASRAGLADGAHCQGGAYALSKEALRRLQSQGLLDRDSIGLMFGGFEDLMTSTLVASTGLQLASHSGPGEPFGVEPSGIPFSPRELVEKQYSIIHSIKNDGQFSEAEIVHFFESRDRIAMSAGTP